jgi:hypothetical protein
MRDTMLGWLASRILKPQKKTNIISPRGTSPADPPAASSKPTCTSAIRPMADRNTARR